MPRIENEFLPQFNPGELAFVPVLSAFPSAQGTFLVDDQNVASPVVVDAEREVFRQLKVANSAFPLNVVIDRDGNVAHVDNEFEYTTAAAAAVQAEVEG